ncbi:MAG: carboxymuconolactone decarboxylase family protein [Alphaproteobacteria bacterium]
MARIPYIDPADAPEPIAKLLEDLPPLNIFMMMAHTGQTLRDFVQLGNRILFEGTLDPALRELAILRVAHLSGATYERHHHEKIARQLEIPARKIEAVERGGAAAIFSELERHVLLFVDDVVNNVRASDETFAPLSRDLTHAALQELVLTIGYYMMVARFLETFDVDLEEDSDVGLTLRQGSSGG